MITYVIPCLLGLEKLVSDEVKRLGLSDVQAENGRVLCQGAWADCARLNVNLRCGARVIAVLARFPARSFEELFQGTRSVAWEEYLPLDAAFPVKGYSINSQLFSIPACQSIIKKAAVDRLSGAYHINSFAETGAVCRIQFSLQNNHVCMYLDTSGTSLHKRGYRQNANLAPIKETLAAGILDLARIRGNSVLCDPFCGSGTFLIEGAIKALHIAPGINRQFAASKWGWVPQEIWREERGRAIDSVRRDADFEAYGWDIDPDCVELARENAKKAGVASRIHIEQGDVRKFIQPEHATVVCNPPYGERMLEVKEAEELYAVMGKRFPADAAHPCYIISPHETFESHFGKSASKRRKLYNGMLKCQLFMYFK